MNGAMYATSTTARPMRATCRGIAAPRRRAKLASRAKLIHRSITNSYDPDANKIWHSPYFVSKLFPQLVNQLLQLILKLLTKWTWAVAHPQGDESEPDMQRECTTDCLYATWCLVALRTEFGESPIQSGGVQVQFRQSLVSGKFR